MVIKNKTFPVEKKLESINLHINNMCFLKLSKSMDFLDSLFILCYIVYSKNTLKRKCYWDLLVSLVIVPFSFNIDWLFYHIVFYAVGQGFSELLCSPSALLVDMTFQIIWIYIIIRIFSNLCALTSHK